MLLELNDKSRIIVDSFFSLQDVVRNRLRNALEITFSVETDKEINAILKKLTATNLTKLTIYYANETGVAPEGVEAETYEEELSGVAHDVFDMYTIIGSTMIEEYEKEVETNDTPSVYGKRLIVKLGQKLLSEA